VSLTPTARGGLAVLWVGLVVWAVVASPPARPDQGEWLIRLLTGDWAGEEPWVVVVFNLMGVWPFALAALLAGSMRREPVPLWPFALSSMFVGAFGLVPGLVIGGRDRPMAAWQRWLQHPALRVGLAGVTLVLLAWAVGAGEPAEFLEAFRTEQFVHVMTLDFAALWVTSVVVAHARGGRWAWAFVPILGALGLAGPRDA